MIVAGLMGVTVTAVAQTRLDGQFYSQVYGLENRSDGQQWDFYQGLILRLRPADVPGLSLKTNFRLARRGDPSDWDEAIYNAYVEYRRPGSKYAVRAGRQFLYRGVISGSMDALSIEAFPSAGLNLQFIGGFAVPFDRSLNIQSWDNGGVLGAYGRYQISPNTRATASYISRRSGGKVAWHQLGAAVNGVFNRQFYYQAQIEYNLEENTDQAMRYRVIYVPSRWSISAEFVRQRPRVYEDSFFKIFELEAFNQVRAGSSYRTDQFEAGLQFVHTVFDEDETADEIFATLALGVGTVGFVYKSGYGGESTGVFGDIEVDLLDNLSARLRSSYYSYERRSVSFTEDATSFAGGFRYRPVPSVILRAELQESINSAFDDDLRLYIRASYLIDHN